MEEDAVDDEGDGLLVSVPNLTRRMTLLSGVQEVDITHVEDARADGGSEVEQRMAGVEFELHLDVDGMLLPPFGR